MIEIAAAAGEAMMQGLLERLDSHASAATCALYQGTRPPAGQDPASPTDLLATLVLAKPSGSVNSSGTFTLATSADGQLVRSGAPTWARLRTGNGSFVLDCDARLLADAETGQEIVIAATALLAGAFVRLGSGTFTVM
ncbi:MAG: hypothetical protein ACKVIH_04065 [Burkholderiales bacterium]